MRVSGCEGSRREKMTRWRRMSEKLSGRKSQFPKEIRSFMGEREGTSPPFFPHNYFVSIPSYHITSHVAYQPIHDIKII